MVGKFAADAKVAAEVATALDALLIQRGRAMMLVGLGAALVFIPVTHFIGSATRWTDLMNASIAVLLAISLALSRWAPVRRNMLLLCLLIGIVVGAMRAVAGIWHGDLAAGTIFNVTMALLVAAALPWGAWPQAALVVALGAEIVVNIEAVHGTLTPESGRAAANVALGLGASVLLAAATRRQLAQLFADGFSRRDAEAALARLNVELEQRIDLRTAELRRVQQAALQHQADLAHVLRVDTMGELTAGLAHEINQPLGAIANYAQGCVHRLRAGTLDQAALLPIVEEIASEALRAGEIIRRLRDLVRKDSGRLVEADLNHLVRESVRLIEPEARARGVAVRLELAEALPTVVCNDIQIEQVLLNLILNGVEAVEASGNGHRALSVCTTLADGTAEVAVCDSGTGLPAPPADVFAPFYTTKASGLGMGLSISRSIIEAHGGRLWGTGNPDRGATFRFTLPVV